MKKTNTDIQDIYRSEESKPEPQQTSGYEMSEDIDRQVRRRQIFNFAAALLTLALTVFLTSSIVKDYLIVSRPPLSAAEKIPYFAVYALPLDEQWVLEYRQVARQADSSETTGPKPLSTKWVKNAAYHIIMGQQAFRQNELLAAQEHLEKAVLTFPAVTGVRHLLGIVYLKRQNFEKAAEQLEKALEEAPSPAVLNNLGVAYIGVGEYVRAEALLRQALRQQPDLADCYKNLAFLYQKTGRTEEVSASFEEYFSVNPKDTKLIQNYVAYLSASGQNRHAIEFLERLDGADPLTVSVLLARTAAQDNDTERAIRSLQEAARFLTPRQMITEMHNAAFEKITRAEPFEALLHRLELAAVSLATNLDTKVESKD